MPILKRRTVRHLEMREIDHNYTDYAERICSTSDCVSIAWGLVIDRGIAKAELQCAQMGWTS